MADATVLVDEAVRDGIAHLGLAIAAFDGKGRILLLRQAPGNALPVLWETPCRQVSTASPRSARRKVNGGKPAWPTHKRGRRRLAPGG